MKIRLYDHPFVVAEPKVFEVNSLAEWLFDYYGDSPAVKVQIFSGEPSVETDISDDIAAIMAGDANEYIILQSPAGFDPISWAYIVIAVLVVATIVLMPKPVMPGNINRTQQSPNNALGDRENKLRLLERVEDIYGTVKSIPSLMMPTYNKYINHSKYEYGYYCIGRGYYDITDVKDGDTLIAAIDGASAAVYAPFTSPNNAAPYLQIGGAIIDNVLTTRRAIEVDGITLKALNQVQLAPVVDYNFAPGNRIYQQTKKPNFNAVAAVGDTLIVSMANTVVSTSGSATFTIGTHGIADTSGAQLFAGIVVGDSVTVSGTISNNGIFTVTSKPNANTLIVSQALVTESVAAATFKITRNYSGSYVVTAVGDGYVDLSVNTWPSSVFAPGASVQIAGRTNYTDWVTLPIVDRTEVWCNVTAPNGMFKDDGGGKAATSVNFSIEIERLTAALVPTGIVETVSGTLSGSVQDERADTIEHATSWTGPARVRMRRTSAYDYDFGGGIQDEIKWTDLYSASYIDRSEFGNKTTIHTVTQATARATAVKTRQLNCLASRKLPIFDGTSFSGTLDANGRLIFGVIGATSKIVDIIAAVSSDPKIGRRDLATEIDMAQIWSVQQKLDAWNVNCGQFNFTFDTDNTSFEETITSIANAGFCIAYRQNGKIRLAFDQKQTSSTALFTHRNKKPNAETITRNFSSDAEYDGVEFIYVDPDSDQSETITLPLNGIYTKLKKFEIAGIRSYEQAWLRANREYQKLIGQRISIETSTTSDARSLLPNSRVDIVDNTRFKSYDGEVVGQQGLELTLSQNVTFLPGAPHSIILMRRDGSLQSIRCTAGSAPNKIVLGSLPSEAVVTSYGQDGIRTIYSFAADTTRGAQAYLVQEIDLSDAQYPAIRAINYSDDYYLKDYEIIPNKDAVIS
ncbi:host specificity factor TipJ family phage tail protein [Collimonas fungivorans]|nr:host specificity factor TipJ family phage tail protein [Collimonas fungivorans]